MKTKKEIEEKINGLQANKDGSHSAEETLYWKAKIDILLWVLGDED